MTDCDLRKAALVLASLPEEDAACLLARLAPDEVEAVAIAIAGLQGAAEDERHAAARDFAAACAGVPGGLETASRLVEKALGPRAGSTLERVYRRLVSTPGGMLPAVDGCAILPLLVDEHPQTIAVALSRLPADQAAEVLDGLPPFTQSTVLRRIAVMDRVPRDAVRDVEQGLLARMTSCAQQPLVGAGGVDCAARILATVEGATRQYVVGSLTQDHPDLMAEIHRHMAGAGHAPATAAPRANAA